MGLGRDLSSPEMWVRGMGSWVGPGDSKVVFQPSGIGYEAEEGQRN